MIYEGRIHMGLLGQGSGEIYFSRNQICRGKLEVPHVEFCDAGAENSHCVSRSCLTPASRVMHGVEREQFMTGKNKPLLVWKPMIVYSTSAHTFDAGGNSRQLAPVHGGKGR